MSRNYTQGDLRAAIGTLRLEGPRTYLHDPLVRTRDRPRHAAMTIWNVDIMWAMMLFGVTLFTSCVVVVNRAMRGMRTVGLVTCYAAGLAMVLLLPWKVAVVTWCVFAAAGGLFVLAYELWARRRYAGTGRSPRPLILLQGFVLWPAMIPEAIEGMVTDAGILPPMVPPAQRDDPPPTS